MEGVPSANDVIKEALKADVPQTLGEAVIEKTIELMDAAGNNRVVEFINRINDGTEPRSEA